MTKTNEETVYVVDTKGNLVPMVPQKPKKVVPVIRGTQRK